MSSWRGVILLLIAALIGSGAGWVVRGDTPGIATVEVVRGELAETVELSGTLEPARQTMIRGSVSGRIAQIAVRPGDVVRRGDILAVLDPTPFHDAIASAQRTVEAAELDVSLGADESAGTSPRSMATLAAAVRAEDARIALERARANLAATLIISSHDGIVLDLPLVSGAYYSAGTDAAVLMVGGRYQATADLDELDVPFVHPGASIRARIEAIPAMEFTGRVASVAPQGTVTGGGTVFRVTIDFNAFTDLPARPGMTVTLTFTITASDALIIPVEAVHTAGARSYVSRMNDGQAELIEVHLGRRSGGLVEVSAGSIQSGDRLVI